MSQADSLLGLEAVDEILEVSLHLVLKVLDLLSEVGSHVGDLGAGRLALALVTTLVDNIGEVGRATTVPCENVLGLAWDIRENTDSTDGDEMTLELLGCDVGNSIGGALSWLERE